MLGKEISPFICTEFSCENNFTFVREIQNAGIHGGSFVVEIAVDTLLKNKLNLKMTHKDHSKLFKYAHFLFKGEYYEQCDGVDMGSPISHYSQHIL